MNRDIQKRKNDFPELQIGYPERNDVRDPNTEMERLHVDLDSLELRRTKADELTRDNNAQGNISRNR
jgi:hypothetical protein